jgi:transcriptional regulator with XRE-family HTH domain
MVRQEKGLLQAELAEKTGLKQPNLSRIENALVVPRMVTLEKIAKALGVTAEELYSEARVQEVERKWAASLGPKHAALMMTKKLTAVPLLDTSAGYPGTVAAHGEPQAGLEVVMQLPLLPAESSYFALRVHGDKMVGRGGSFRQGEVLVFSVNAEVKDGDLAFVVSKDGGDFCRVEMPDANSLRLVWRNSAKRYPAKTMRRSQVARMWRLVGHMRTF